MLAPHSEPASERVPPSRQRLIGQAGSHNFSGRWCFLQQAPILAGRALALPDPTSSGCLADAFPACRVWVSIPVLAVLVDNPAYVTNASRHSIWQLAYSMFH